MAHRPSEKPAFSKAGFCYLNPINIFYGIIIEIDLIIASLTLIADKDKNRYAPRQLFSIK